MTKVKLCNVEELFLAIGNINLTPMVTAPASFTIRALDLPCTCSEFAQVQQVSGGVTFSYQHTASTQDAGVTTKYDINEGADANFALPQKSVGQGGVSFWGQPGGTGVIHNVYTEIGQYTTSITKTDGNGALIYIPDEGSQVDLNINLVTCTYNFNMSSYLDMTTTDSGGTSQAIQGEIGFVDSEDYPLILTSPNTTLSGSMDFPAHSIAWGLSNSGSAFYPMMEGFAMFLNGGVTDDNAGSAAVTWSFSAPIPASSNGQ